MDTLSDVKRDVSYTTLIPCDFPDNWTSTVPRTQINGKPGEQHVRLMDSSLYDAVSPSTSRFHWFSVESFHS